MKILLKLAVILLLTLSVAAGFNSIKTENENKILVEKNKQLSYELEKIQGELDKDRASLASYKEIAKRAADSSSVLEEYKKTIEELGAHLASLEKSLGKEYTNPIDWKTLKENDWAYGMRVSYSSSQDGSPYVEFQGMTVISGEFRIPDVSEIGKVSSQPVEFSPDEMSLKLLPRLKGYDDPVVINFRNNSDALKLLGAYEKTGMATVVIDDYIIDKTSREKRSSARLICVTESNKRENSKDHLPQMDAESHIN